MEIDATKLWDRFILKVAIDAFGEPAVLSGAKLKNFLGAVSKHKAIFMAVVDELIAESGTDAKLAGQ